MSSQTAPHLQPVFKRCSTPSPRHGAALAVTVLFLALSARAQTIVTTPMIAAGQAHTIALRANGTVQSYGYNANGELGLGHLSNQNAPQTIPGLSNVVAVAAGWDHSLALCANGTVKSWGWNYAGQLGLGNTVTQTTPQTIPGLSGVVAVHAGLSHSSYALLANGTVMAWGSNGYTQLGMPSLYANNWNQPTPQLIPGLTGVTAIAAGYDHTLALLSSGVVMVCGRNNHGEFGNGTWYASQSVATFQPVPGLSNVTAIAAGENHCLALLSDGTMRAWGFNNEGQLGIGNNVRQTTPQPIPGLTGVLTIASGAHHNIAKLSSGAVMAWGRGYDGQLGIGGYQGAWGPAVNTPQPITVYNNVNPQISLGGFHSFSLLPNGSVHAWGSNWSGQLGLGDNNDRNSPVNNPSGVLCSTSGYSLSIATAGSTGVGITIPCNTEVGALAGSHAYFNAFSLDPANASSPGTGAWFGLHITQAEVLAWLNAGANGLAVAFGPLGSSGGATATIAISPLAIAGLTIHGVSIAINPLTGQVIADSPVTSHTF